MTIEAGQTPRPLACCERAVVLLNGEYDLSPDFFKLNRQYETFDFFCADGGANLAVRLGIVPQLVMGDMDSITIQTRRRLEKLSRFIELPVDKDISDAESLLKMLNQQGYREIHLFAATGGRLDQTMFNLQLLRQFPQARIITSNEEISFIDTNGYINDKSGCRASLLALSSRVSQLTLEGFKFNLQNQDIESGTTLTLSNVIVSNRARISYEEGALLLIVERLAPPTEKPRQRLHLIK